MTPRSVKEVVFEVKPKWLAQSPNAPLNSIRCRQCARVARRNAERRRKGEMLLSTYCPLDLVSKDRRHLKFVAQKVCGKARKARILQIAHWLETNTLFPRLAEYQRQMDRVGVLNADANDENFLVAMTLRDCSVYVRFPENGGDAIEARLGDLDLKNPKKMDYWRDIEESLIDEWWYLGLEKPEDREPIECHLNTRRWLKRRNSI